MKLRHFYIAFTSPLLIIVLISAYVSGELFVLLLGLYYVYRCILDYYKLKSNQVVTKKDWWKFAMGIWTFVYFKQLYFE